MSRRVLVLLSSILTALALVYLSNRISHSFRDSAQVLDKKSIGLITADPKSVQIRSGQGDFIANQTRTVEIHDGDEIVLALGSKATLSVADYDLILRDRAQIKIELWNDTLTNSPIYITPLHGEIVMAKKGKPGMVYVVYDRRMIPPEAIPAKKDARSTLNEPVLLSKDQSDSDTTPAEPNPATVTEPAKTVSTPMKTNPPPTSTLSNDEIATALGNNASQLRRCQMNSLRDGESANGSILLSITIEGTGKVKAVSILKDETQNESLVSCATTVVNRVQFRAYNGDPITISYPIEFR